MWHGHSSLSPLAAISAHANHYLEHVAPSLERRVTEISELPWSEQEILDVGCGYSYPVVAALKANVRRIAGVDLCTFWRDGWIAAYHALQPTRGPRGLFACLGRHFAASLLFREYRRAGIAIEHASYDLQRYEGRTLPFDDASFTCVISNSVLQYVPDLDTLARENARVLRPGGIVDHRWHNPFSVLGNLRNERLSLAIPWGHLTGELPRRPDIHLHTPEDIRQAFSRHLEVVGLYRGDTSYRVFGEDPAFEEERADLYDQALARSPALRAHPRELLVTRGYFIQLRKPA